MKEVLLIFNFDQAPKSLQVATSTQNENLIRLTRAQAAWKAAKAELAAAQDALAAGQDSFDKELAAWDTASIDVGTDVDPLPIGIEPKPVVK